MKKTTLTCLCLLVAGISLAQISPQEKQALLDFYNATDGTNWKNTWNLEAPVSEWYGVTITNNEVTEISMLFNNVKGTLPSSLGQLQSLRKLELSFNPITGNLPESIGNLANLEFLACNGTDLEGSIPASIGKLSQLKELHLSSNRLSGTIPENLGNLAAIEVFNVFDNNLNGALPKSLAKCRNLRQLMVAENHFTNPEDFSIVVLSNGSPTLDLTKQPVPPAHTIIAIERDESKE